ncbi:cytochrome c oxidase assembly protein COX11, mitochondrial-like [Mizuhopecten yessoensis]|uniref:cytochrome c oxidase assembly protein COX11, mitochondrial-like n=1 Tax=Mizuhopecten yessoensis TaxID=6573 RepID=UPI000B45D74A|nr:cytochrome c oxidase assembly protein COX11, mitochondrial-like [Mizuhopecten yessoensis]XP_021348727.1 cytochrome c oxidase assembly protein COX11, mitochondrial-like [Mizuhopecten yessoensis]XP_021348728.1 cytochrome c oxidase assembly protein COX11, mitochondrial-like [Mizuhopecten yessoensis]
MSLVARLGHRFRCLDPHHQPCVLTHILQQMRTKSYPFRTAFQSRTVCFIPKSNTNTIVHRLQSLCNVQCLRPSQYIITRCVAMNSKERLQAQKRKHITLYLMSMSLFMLGMGFAAVPLYRIFCQATGIGGKAVRGHDVDKVEELSKVEDQVIKVMFTADKNSSLRWKFTPQQSFVNVALGETALAFYTAENPTDEPIVGVSTYTVNPIEAGLYFNKIQCFCFEEQLLKPHEKVDLPVFFYIDPEFQDNPFLADCDNVVLSYTFFQAKPGLHLPLPGFHSAKS